MLPKSTWQALPPIGSQPGGFQLVAYFINGDLLNAVFNVRYGPDSDRIADISASPSRADFVAKVVDGLCEQ
jgi:hypothetical protein